MLCHNSKIILITISILIFVSILYILFKNAKDDIDKMSVSSSDSQLSSHAEVDLDSENSDFELDTKILNVDDVQSVRYRKKDRSLMLVLLSTVF